MMAVVNTNLLIFCGFCVACLVITVLYNEPNVTVYSSFKQINPFSSDLFSKDLQNESDIVYQGDDTSEADALKARVRVLVMVMTQPQSLATKATAVKNTWGNRTNKILFMSSEDNPDFPTVKIDVPDGRDHLTAKTMRSFDYVYDNYFDDYDWFMKADDDTYVIVENLRYFLSAQNTSEPIFFGQLFRTFVKQGYMSGGAGYVLSKEALRRLVKHNAGCAQDGSNEDVEIGKCLEKIGVLAGNSTDAFGKTRFHLQHPAEHLSGRFTDWLYRIEANGYVNHGTESISDYAISYHYVPPQDMVIFHYLLYHLRPYGIKSSHQDVNGHNKNRLIEEGVNLDFGNFTCMLEGHGCKEGGWNTHM